MSRVHWDTLFPKMLQKGKSPSGHTFQSALSIVIVLLIWVVFIPAQFGGNLNYVVITGNSMEPLFHAGDFVVADNDTKFTVGDIVVYNHPEVGKIIHRIIGRDGERFVLQGDNNSWVDGYEPSRQEIIGKYWFSIPKVGTVLLKLKKPWSFTIFTGISTFIVGVSMIKTTNREKKKSMKNSRFLHDFGVKVSQWKDGYWFPVYFLGLGCLILGIFSFIKPPFITVQDERSYTQTGQFSYSGVSSQDIYNQNTIQTGDPIFTALTCKVKFSFDYLVKSANAVDGEGDYQLTTALTSTNGWSHIVSQTQLTTFQGDSFHVEQPIDVCELQEYLTFVGTTTGVEGQFYTLEIRPSVNFSGDVDGNPVKTQFAPALKMRMDTKQVFLAEDPASDEADPLKPILEGVVREEKTMPNAINILGLKVPVKAGRVISVAGLALAILGIIIPELCYLQANKTDSKLKDRMLYGHRLVEIRQSPVGKNDQVIELSSMDDILALAEKTDANVLSYHNSEGTEYFVHNNQKFFKYTKKNDSSTTSS